MRQGKHLSRYLSLVLIVMGLWEIYFMNNQLLNKNVSAFFYRAEIPFRQNCLRRDRFSSTGHQNIYPSKENHSILSYVSSYLLFSKFSSNSGLIMTTNVSLQSLFNTTQLTPLERIVLNADGNLQRIFSSFYNSPVFVHVDLCKHREIPESLYEIYDRISHLSVNNKVFCTAKTVFIVKSLEYASLIQSKEIGIGQLFRYLNILPSFSLIDAGKTLENRLWRIYILRCDGLICIIQENFTPNLWKVSPL